MMMMKAVYISICRGYGANCTSSENCVHDNARQLAQDIKITLSIREDRRRSRLTLTQH